MDTYLINYVFLIFYSCGTVIYLLFVVADYTYMY